MTYYADLTPYAYAVDGLSPGPERRNIGWLGPVHPFDTGRVDERVRAALLAVLSVDGVRQNTMRGCHDCPWCEVESPVSYPAPTSRGWVSVGMDELHVAAADGTVYVAPSLVVHYVLAHDYRPPVEFQRALLHLCADRVPEGVGRVWRQVAERASPRDRA